MRKGNGWQQMKALNEGYLPHFGGQHYLDNRLAGTDCVQELECRLECEHIKPTKIPPNLLKRLVGAQGLEPWTR